MHRYIARIEKRASGTRISFPDFGIGSVSVGSGASGHQIYRRAHSYLTDLLTNRARFGDLPPVPSWNGTGRAGDCLAVTIDPRTIPLPEDFGYRGVAAEAAQMPRDQPAQMPRAEPDGMPRAETKRERRLRRNAAATGRVQTRPSATPAVEEVAYVATTHQEGRNLIVQFPDLGVQTILQPQPDYKSIVSTAGSLLRSTAESYAIRGKKMPKPMYIGPGYRIPLTVETVSDLETGQYSWGPAATPSLPSIPIRRVVGRNFLLQSRAAELGAQRMTQAALDAGATIVGDEITWPSDPFVEHLVRSGKPAEEPRSAIPDLMPAVRSLTKRRARKAGATLRYRLTLVAQDGSVIVRDHLSLCYLRSVLDAASSGWPVWVRTGQIIEVGPVIREIASTSKMPIENPPPCPWRK